ncbi:MAG TPA: hypothetical protein VFL93_01335 [Longimicrobiaceae bacterium]|nr:hypothetical protein [Longimicrobiaceae bacterium]
MDSQTLLLEFDERHSAPVLIRKQTTRRSLHTGRDLVELHGWMTAGDEAQHQALSELLRDIGDRAVRASDESGDFAGKWCVSWNSYAESGGVHTYILLLREAEEISLEALLVGDLELHPYEYREAVLGGGLALWAKAVGSETDLRRLRALFRERPAVPIVRHGVDEHPREMRLAAAEWSTWEDRVKYRLVLVEGRIDEGEHSAFARVERENSRAALGFYMNFADRLVDLMVSKGLVTRSEIDAVREAAATAPALARHDFWHIPDIDAL